MKKFINTTVKQISIFRAEKNCSTFFRVFPSISEFLISRVIVQKKVSRIVISIDLVDIDDRLTIIEKYTYNI